MGFPMAGELIGTTPEERRADQVRANRQWAKIVPEERLMEHEKTPGRARIKEISK